MLHVQGRIRVTLLLLAFCLLSSPSARAAQRTFVSTAGSDANTASNCSNTAPCRGFTAALTVTDSGGEIIVKDSGGYGPVTINKTVSLIAPDGVYAGISVASGDGISIATGGVDVVLKGLTINYMGGTNGINMTAGSSLTVEKCTIKNFAADRIGILVNAAAAVRILDSLLLKNGSGASLENASQALISGSRFIGNHNGLSLSASGATTIGEMSRSEVVDAANLGVSAYADSGGTLEFSVKDSLVATSGSQGVVVTASGGTVRASVAGSLITGNASDGLYAVGSGARLVSSGNVIVHNGTGLDNQPGGSELVSTGDNTVSDNTTATLGTIGTLTKM